MNDNYEIWELRKSLDKPTVYHGTVEAINFIQACKTHFDGETHFNPSELTYHSVPLYPSKDIAEGYIRERLDKALRRVLGRDFPTTKMERFNELVGKIVDTVLEFEIE